MPFAPSEPDDEQVEEGQRYDAGAGCGDELVELEDDEGGQRRHRPRVDPFGSDQKPDHDCGFDDAVEKEIQGDVEDAASSQVGRAVADQGCQDVVRVLRKLLRGSGVDRTLKVGGACQRVMVLLLARSGVTSSTRIATRLGGAPSVSVMSLVICSPTAEQRRSRRPGLRS